MKIGLLTLLWKRHKIASFVLNHYSQMQLDGIELVLHCVGSEGEVSQSIAEQAGWNYTEHPNDPFSDKWNCASEWFKDKDVEALCIIGSDNLLNEEYFYRVAGAVKAGLDSVRLGGSVLRNVKTGEMLYYGNVMVGSGKAWSRELLEKLNYKMWIPGRGRGSDKNTETLTLPYQRRHCITTNPLDLGICHLELKGGEDLHRFESIAPAMQTTPFNELDQYFDNHEAILSL
ncbi:hypothetical protein [Gracilimonas sediminicola]|uniref:Uncharacterized protein n=1 Tax=Gracilimonas sediminicola TaxID=2952158 RepID=A0A9X2L0G6_9BACT|nr:hypothetical protein [Gracilimonas sediminicola]MCP9289998.1 hypothetical protein [Gracilimonas sediminicola]